MAAKMVGMHRRMLGMCEQIDIEEERLMIWETVEGEVLEPWQRHEIIVVKLFRIESLDVEPSF
jgi:hypothetical protein